MRSALAKRTIQGMKREATGTTTQWASNGVPVVRRSRHATQPFGRLAPTQENATPYPVVSAQNLSSGLLMTQDKGRLSVPPMCRRAPRGRRVFARSPRALCIATSP
jgi:hypothetical protein